LAGQWDFDFGDLRATAGNPLEYLGGEGSPVQTKTLFGTTEALGVPAIGGRVAKVMEVPGDVTRDIGYVMTHGIAPNGGGTRVNQYTLIMDVFVDTTGPGAASLWQTSSASNSDDGDLFWQGDNFGQGTGGYNGRGTFKAGEWHRVVAAYDMAANPPVVTKYVDGIKQDDWTANQGLDNARRSLLPTAVLFGDGDQDERRRMWVNSIQIRAGKISDAEATVLGGPSADGIPTDLKGGNVAGQWDFDFADLGASIGKPLSYLDGAEGETKNGTLYGTTADLGIEPINGEVAKVMKSPGELSKNIGYIMDHGIAPNGGGTRVNQYTLIMDIYVDTTGSSAASLWQTSSTSNSDDGDLFWQGSNFGQGHRWLQRPWHVHGRCLAPRGGRVRHGCESSGRREVRRRHQAGRVDGQPGSRQRPSLASADRGPLRRRRSGRASRVLRQLRPDPFRSPERRGNRLPRRALGRRHSGPHPAHDGDGPVGLRVR
jgi:hypothetical protein